LNVSGTGNLFIDNQLVVDLSTNPPSGNTFVGFGTAEVSNVVKGLQAGQKYKVEVRISNVELVEKGLPFPCWGGLRFGGIKVVEDEAALNDAIQLAKESDGELAFLACSTENFLISVANSCDIGCWTKPRVCCLIRRLTFLLT